MDVRINGTEFLLYTFCSSVEFFELNSSNPLAPEKTQSWLLTAANICMKMSTSTFRF